MTQGVLPFQYLDEKKETQFTSFAGLPLYVEMAITSGLCAEIKQCLQTKVQGWSDEQLILSLILLNLVGGDCVDDIERLEADKGLSSWLLRIENHGMKGRERRAYERRFRKCKQRTFPSASVIRRYLEQFHSPEAEGKRVKGEAFIPQANKVLQQLIAINHSMLQFAQRKNPQIIATCDQDATLVPTYKKTAYYCYEHYKAYQPFNTYWYEQGMLIHSEFRDGNVPAGYDQLRVLEQSLACLPMGIEKVYLRSDAAGYQQALLEYCAKGKHPRFGVIEFAIATKVSAAFKAAVGEVKEADWTALYKESEAGHIPTNQAWAEVNFVPHWAGYSRNDPTYRYLAIRETMMDEPLGEEQEEELPFQTITLSEQTYKVFGLITNRTLEGQALITWHRQRCGASERVHHIEKNELAGGQLPSQKFGANAAWWQIMVLAFNLHSLMQQFVLPPAFKSKGMKALRFHVMGVAGQLIHHARGIGIKLSGGSSLFACFNDMRYRIKQLAIPPPCLKLTTG